MSGPRPSKGKRDRSPSPSTSRTSITWRESSSGCGGFRVSITLSVRPDKAVARRADAKKTNGSGSGGAGSHRALFPGNRGRGIPLRLRPGSPGPRVGSGGGGGDRRAGRASPGERQGDSRSGGGRPRLRGQDDGLPDRPQGLSADERGLWPLFRGGSPGAGNGPSRRASQGGTCPDRGHCRGVRRGRESGYGFDNHSGAKASGADPNSLAGALEDDANALEVGVPNPLRHIVRVADLVAETWSLPTDLTDPGHSVSLQDTDEGRSLAHPSRRDQIAEPIPYRQIP